MEEVQILTMCMWRLFKPRSRRQRGMTVAEKLEEAACPKSWLQIIFNILMPSNISRQQNSSKPGAVSFFPLAASVPSDALVNDNKPPY